MKLYALWTTLELVSEDIFTRDLSNKEGTNCYWSIRTDRK